MTTTTLETTAEDLYDLRQRALARVNASLPELEHRESTADLTYSEWVALTTARGIDLLLTT